MSNSDLVEPSTTQTINPYWEELSRTRVHRTWLGLPDFRGESRLSGMSSLISLMFPSESVIQAHVSRNDYCSRYTWAIPDTDALAFVAQWLAPRAVEMGAGMGYWAWQLSQLGIDMLAYDVDPPDDGYNPYHNRDGKAGMVTYHPVLRDTTKILAHAADRVLFLCWPPYEESMAADCLAAYPGKRFIYIGEPSGGCTGDEAFFTCLEREWQEIATHRIEQWDGMHDRIWVYERTAEGTTKRIEEENRE